MKFFVIILSLLVSPGLMHAASFDCSKASSNNEIAICNDPELSSLDELLAATYKQTRNMVDDPKRLRNEQVSWIKSVVTCNGRVDCLIGAYRDRIRVLDYVDGVITIIDDPYNERLAILNEREELLNLRENALTTELRALNAAIERFEEQKRQFESARRISVQIQTDGLRDYLDLNDYEFKVFKNSSVLSIEDYESVLLKMQQGPFGSFISDNQELFQNVSDKAKVQQYLRIEQFAQMHDMSWSEYFSREQTWFIPFKDGSVNGGGRYYLTNVRGPYLHNSGQLVLSCYYENGEEMPIGANLKSCGPYVFR